MEAVTCYEAAMTAPVATAAVGRGGVAMMMMMPEDNPREGHGSLMMLRRAIRVMRLRNHVVTRGWRVRGTRMVVTACRCVMIRVVRGGAVVIVVLLLRLSLAVLLVLHPAVLKPDLHLTLG